MQSQTHLVWIKPYMFIKTIVRCKIEFIYFFIIVIVLSESSNVRNCHAFMESVNFYRFNSFKCLDAKVVEAVALLVNPGYIQQQTNSTVIC